jgi:hypothetical protein
MTGHCYFRITFMKSLHIGVREAMIIDADCTNGDWFVLGQLKTNVFPKTYRSFINAYIAEIYSRYKKPEERDHHVRIPSESDDGSTIQTDGGDSDCGGLTTTCHTMGDQMNKTVTSLSNKLADGRKGHNLSAIQY